MDGGKEQSSKKSNMTTTAGDISASSDPGKKKSKLPSPRELVSHYESRGMDTQEASFKVIEDLQNAVLKMMVSSSGRRNSSPGAGLASDTSRKLDVIAARMIQLDTKLDSKPGHAQTLAIGLGSGVLLQAFTSAAAQVWAAVRRATSTNSDFR